MKYENNLMKALQEGKILSPLGKLQLATSLIQEVLNVAINNNMSEEFTDSLVMIQYKLWVYCNCGEFEKNEN